MWQWRLALVLLTSFLIPVVAPAQTLERTRTWDVGDKLTYTYVLKGQTLDAVEEVVEVTGSVVRTRLTIGAETYDAAYSTVDQSRMSGICVANSEACVFAPGEPWVDFPLEVGKAWSNAMTVTGETFVSGSRQSRKVEALEVIRTPAGEFQAYRVSFAGRITARGKGGQGPWRGTEKATYWLSTVKGKLVSVRLVYENSFGARSSRELVAVDMK